MTFKNIGTVIGQDNVNLKLYMMSKKVTPKNNQANQGNANQGQAGGNKQNAQVHGNRGAQLNPNQKKGK